MVGKSYSLFRFQKLWLNFYTLLYAFRFFSCCGRSLSNPRSLHVSNVRLRNHLSYVFLLGSGFTNLFFPFLFLSHFSLSLLYTSIFLMYWKTKQRLCSGIAVWCCDGKQGNDVHSAWRCGAWKHDGSPTSTSGEHSVPSEPTAKVVFGVFNTVDVHVK